MSSNNVTPKEELEHLKRMADVHASMARLYTKEWLKCHKRLFLMSQCARYEFFCKNTVQFNALVLKDLRCKPLRECLQEVLKAQRDLKKFDKKVSESFKESNEFDEKFWALKKQLQEEAAAAEANSASST